MLKFEQASPTFSLKAQWQYSYRPSNIAGMTILAGMTINVPLSLV
jgi:hypothetical protein